jgi:hypothetical protein
MQSVPFRYCRLKVRPAFLLEFTDSLTSSHELKGGPQAHVSARCACFKFHYMHYIRNHTLHDCSLTLFKTIYNSTKREQTC